MYVFVCGVGSGVKTNTNIGVAWRVVIQCGAAWRGVEVGSVELTTSHLHRRGNEFFLLLRRRTNCTELVASACVDLAYLTRSVRFEWYMRVFFGGTEGGSEGGGVGVS